MYRKVMPTVIVCQNLTAGHSSHYLHPGWERVFLVLVVELVMERGGAEGLKHQAKVRSCGATRNYHQQGNIVMAQIMVIKLLGGLRSRLDLKGC